MSLKQEVETTKEYMMIVMREADNSGLILTPLDLIDLTRNGGYHNPLPSIALRALVNEGKLFKTNQDYMPIINLAERDPVEHHPV